VIGLAIMHVDDGAVGRCQDRPTIGEEPVCEITISRIIELGDGSLSFIVVHASR
jgi:hypothetical protein